MELRIGFSLQNGKYRILSVLGQGGFGITYLAEQVALERKVAIKEFFLKDFCDRASDGTTVTLGTQSNKEMMERYLSKFKKEAKIISKFNHPNVIRIHDVFDENNTSYYVMEYIEGQSLSSLIKRKGALSERDAVYYVTCIGKALEYIHGFGVNHLDVKPSNIMIRANGDPVLIDFGVSKQYDSGGQQTSSTPVGISEGFAPSEQYNSGGVSEFSPQTDIYSLGATLFNLVTGKVPPSAFNILNDGIPALPDNLSEGVTKAINWALQPKKRERPTEVSQFLDCIKGERVDETIISSPPSSGYVNTGDDTTKITTTPPTPSNNVTTSEGAKESNLWIYMIVAIVAFILMFISLSECGKGSSTYSMADSTAVDTIGYEIVDADSAVVDTAVADTAVAGYDYY